MGGVLMACNLKMFEGIIGLIVIVFGYWQDWQYSQWITILAGIVLLIHALTCKKHK
ncbi:hypothetical protein HYS50_01550 [Candidatus Woesearchaeota archaeon]|nr:hypothetical protein [Candidatus Woesearchaeota archaeon]